MRPFTTATVPMPELQPAVDVGVIITDAVRSYLRNAAMLLLEAAEGNHWCDYETLTAAESGTSGGVWFVKRECAAGRGVLVMSSSPGSVRVCVDYFPPEAAETE